MDFYEDDESPEEILAKFEAGDKGVTEKPYLTKWIATEPFIVTLVGGGIVDTPMFGNKPMKEYGRY